jgi:signal transduction histidine kinase
MKQYIQILACLLFSNIYPIDSDSLTAINQFKLGSRYIRENLDTSRYYFKKSKKYFIKVNDQTNLAIADKFIGISFAFENRLDSAELYLIKAYNQFIINNDSLNIALILNNLGMIYSSSDYHDLALENLIKSIELKETLINKYGIKRLDLGTTLLNIGVSYQFLYNFPKAKDYYLKAKKLYQNQGDSLGVNKVYYQLANYYSDIDKFSKSEKMFFKVIKSQIFKNNSLVLSQIYFDFGKMYAKQNKFQKSLQKMLKAHEIGKKSNLKSFIKITAEEIAILYFKTKKYTNAIQYALTLFNKKNSNTHSLINIVSQSYEKLGNHALALKYYKLKESVDENIIHTYDTDKYKQIQKELENIQNELKKSKHITLKAIAKTETIKSESHHVIIVLVFIIIILSTFLVYIIYSRLKKLDLEKKNQTYELNQLKNSLQKIFSVVSMDMKNLINQIKGSNILINHYTNTEDYIALKRFTDQLSNNTRNLDLILDNFLKWGLTHTNLYTPKVEKLGAKNIVENQIELVTDLAKRKKVVIFNKIKQRNYVRFDKSNLNFIIRNLLSNSLKYTKDGEISFSYKKTDQNSSIIIEDSGVGIKHNNINKLFILNSEQSKLGTEGESGAGLSMKLIKDFVDMNGAEIKVTSLLHKGTRIEITTLN